MRKQNFADLVQNLAVYFGSTRPSQERMKSWYERVMGLPDEFMAWCVDRIKDNFDAFPRNLSKIILSLWVEWQKEYPNRVVRPQEQTSCPDCIRGWLFAWKQRKNGSWLNAVWKCECNCSPEQGEVTNKWNLENQGWWVEPRTYEPGERHVVNQHKPPAQNNQLSAIFSNENQKG